MCISEMRIDYREKELAGVPFREAGSTTEQRIDYREMEMYLIPVGEAGRHGTPDDGR